MLEKYLIEHCSPTLASLKTANLFTYAYDGEAEFQEEYRLWEARFREKGVSLMAVSYTHLLFWEQKLFIL